jgi:hypothetical protein
MRHYGTVTEGRNVYILTNGTVTETDPLDWSTVAHALWGAHVEEITDAEAALLAAAGYIQFAYGDVYSDTYREAS